jgi:hypothetical protein
MGNNRFSIQEKKNANQRSVGYRRGFTWLYVISFFLLSRASRQPPVRQLNTCLNLVGLGRHDAFTVSANPHLVFRASP